MSNSTLKFQSKIDYNEVIVGLAIWNMELDLTVMSNF